MPIGSSSPSLPKKLHTSTGSAASTSSLGNAIPTPSTSSMPRSEPSGPFQVLHPVSSASALMFFRSVPTLVCPLLLPLFNKKKREDEPTFTLVVSRADLEKLPESETLEFFVWKDPFYPITQLACSFTAKHLLSQSEGFSLDHWRCGRRINFRLAWGEDK